MIVDSDTSNAEYQRYFFPVTDNATMFDPNDAPKDCRIGGTQELFYFWYDRMRKCNNGSKGGWRDQRKVTREMNFYAIDAIGSQLDLNAQQKAWTKNSMTQVDCQRYSNVGGVEIVSFCLCLISCEEDEVCQNRYYHPLSTDDRNDRLFAKLFNSFGFDPQKTANTLQRLRHELGLR